jgi:hypothetical protein
VEPELEPQLFALAELDQIDPDGSGFNINRFTKFKKVVKNIKNVGRQTFWKHCCFYQ